VKVRRRRGFLQYQTVTKPILVTFYESARNLHFSGLFALFGYDVTVEKGERERVPHRKGLARLVAMLRSENVTVT
jgi:hypothetical protein